MNPSAKNKSSVISLKIAYYFIPFLVVSQSYSSEILSEYVIRGNNAVMKCSIPAFVADYVYVTSWIDSDGQVIETGAQGT
jgi:hypothetical protein